jgi:hypothetical protein
MARRPTYGPKDFEEMTALQRKLSEVLLRANQEGVGAVVASFAMLRLVRELMNKIGEGERTALINQVMVPFLQGEPAEGEGGKLITLH